MRDEKEIEEVNKILLDSCYGINIKEGDFYSEFAKHLPQIKNKLGVI